MTPTGAAGAATATAEDAGVALHDLLVALGSAPPPGSDRYWAMAQYLSGGEGWRDAGTALRGTFAGFVLGDVEPAASIRVQEE